MKKTFLLLMGLLLFSASFFGQEELTRRTLTIDDAVMLAADNNLSLQRQKIKLELLEEKNKYSWNSVSPSIKANGSYSLPFEDSDKWQMSGSVSVSLGLSPALFASIKSAKLNYENGIVDYENAVRSIEIEVRKAFYNLLYSKEYLALLNRNIETAKQRYELNLDKYNRGQLSELDLLSSQYAYESLLPNYESRENLYENNIAMFKQILGISQNVEIILEGNLDEFNGFESLSVSTSPDEIPSVKTIKSQIELAKLQLMATRFSAWGPTVSVSYNYGKANSLGMNGERNWNTTGNSLGINLSIPLDGLLPWSSGALNVESQKANLKDLELQLENQKTSVELAINNSIKTILQSQTQLELLNKNVELAQKKYDMTLRAYNLGSKDILTLQDASDSLMNAKLNLMQQKYSMISNILDLENTLGIPFGTLGNEEN